MFARKTLLQIASIAALGMLGSTATADYDCFTKGTLGASANFLNLRCPVNTAQPLLANLHAERELLPGGSWGAYNKWNFWVNVYGTSANPVWTTAFAFDSNGWELASCSIWPSEDGFSGLQIGPYGFCAYTEDDEDDGDFVRPVEFHVYGAQ